MTSKKYERRSRVLGVLKEKLKIWGKIDWLWYVSQKDDLWFRNMNGT